MEYMQAVNNCHSLLYMLDLTNTQLDLLSASFLCTDDTFYY